MSSSYRKTSTRRVAPLLMGAVLAALYALPGRVPAQEITFVPFGSATGEWDSNRQLSRPPVGAGSYGGLVGADLRDYGPRSYMDLSASVSYNDVPHFNYDWVNGNAAFKSDFRTLNADYTFLADYRNDSTFVTEFGQANYNNSLTLTSPDTVGTSNVTTGITRESYEVDPGFDYNITPRLDLEGDFRVNSVHYNEQFIGQRVNYVSPYAGFTLNYDVSQRSSIGIGPYYSRYDETGSVTSTVDGVTTTESGTTTTGGGAFIYNYKTTDVTHMSLILRVERDRIDEAGFSTQDVTSWGVELVGTHKYQLGNIQFSIGRFLEPSSVGGRVALNEFRAQLNRPITARLTFTGALRVADIETIGNYLSSLEPPEHRTNAETWLTYNFTKTWYVTGGYIFVRSRDLGQDNLAYSNGFMLTFGYRGLEPPRPAALGHP
ncbi:MAG TPA: hypothetical protein VIH50_03255 [Steroidobacteraceae bacterium]|jgi:hypothetical protein